MYPSSASSSSQGSMASSSSGGGGGGLMRYGSAPSSVLSAAVDSVIGSGRDLERQSHFGHSRFFGSETSDSSQNEGGPRRSREEANTAIGLQPSFGFGGEGGASSLLRQSSSPAGFLNQFAAAAAAAGDANGFSITSGLGSYNAKGMADTGGGISRLNSQHSFTGKLESLTRISEETEDMNIRRNHATDDDDNNSNNNGQRKHSYAAASSGAAAYGMGAWPEHNNNPMMFSVAPPGRGKSNVVDALDSIESQFQFSISQTAQDMASMEKLLNIPQDSITCKIRAKRGCATHPRSIAERERRTRISGKLKKLQDLVPNMDKQTSYADMLDLAVQHIKTLQNEVQKLNHDLDGCSCGCKNA